MCPVNEYGLVQGKRNGAVQRAQKEVAVATDLLAALPR